MVGSGDHRPSLSQVAETIFPLQVKLRVDATSTGSGGAATMVTRTAGDGLEGQVTVADKLRYWSSKHTGIIIKLTNRRNHRHQSITGSCTVNSCDGHVVGSVVRQGDMCRGGHHGYW